MTSCPLRARIGNSGSSSGTATPVVTSTGPSSTRPSARRTPPSTSACARTPANNCAPARQASSIKRHATRGGYTTASSATCMPPCIPAASAGSNAYRPRASTASACTPTSANAATRALTPSSSCASRATHKVPQRWCSLSGHDAQRCHRCSEYTHKASSCGSPSIATRWPIAAALAPPPMAPLSTTATRRPAATAASTQAAPTMPAPMMIRSWRLCPLTVAGRQCPRRTGRRGRSTRSRVR